MGGYADIRHKIGPARASRLWLAVAWTMIAPACIEVPYEIVSVDEPLPPVTAPASTAPVAFESADGRIALSGTLSLPHGQPPFPAIVVLESELCENDFPQWAPPAFNTWGYATLTVDSYAARGMSKGSCQDFASLEGSDTIADAYGALAALASDSNIDRDRIALVGISDGATTALLADTDEARRAFVHPGDAGFRAVFAVSPFCRFDFTRAAPTTSAPLRIFIGERDDLVPAASCTNLAHALNLRGGDVDTIVYPGAEHWFDYAPPDWSPSPDDPAAMHPWGRAFTYPRPAYNVPFADNLAGCTIRIKSVFEKVEPSQVKDCIRKGGHIAGDASAATDLQVAMKAELHTLLAPPAAPSASARLVRTVR